MLWNVEDLISTDISGFDVKSWDFAEYNGICYKNNLKLYSLDRAVEMVIVKKN